MLHDGKQPALNEPRTLLDSLKIQHNLRINCMQLSSFLGKLSPQSREVVDKEGARTA